MDLLVSVSQGWWAWMGPMLLQSGLVILLVGLVDLAAGRRLWPQVRYTLWLLVLLKLLLPPAWSLPTGLAPRLERHLATRGVELPWAAGGAERPGAVASAPGRSARERPAATPAEPGADSALPRRAALPWTAWAFVVWLAGALAFAAVLTARYAALRRWHDREREGLTIPPWYHELLVATAQRLGVARLPAIVFSDRLLTPAVCGVFRPVMYLPRDYLDTLTREEAEHVLLHELAHLKRGDLWAHGAGLLVQVVYWFNPLVALSRRRTQHVRELCTDLTVANVLRERTAGYRQTLLDTARRLLTESAAPGLGLLGVFEEPYRLVARLRWLERPTWERRQEARAAALVAAVLMLAFVLPMAAGQPRAANTGPALSAVELVAGPRDDGRALYVRNEIRREKYLLDIRLETQQLSVGELWLGDGVMSTREGGRTTIVDLRAGVLTYVNHDDRTYVTSPLPLDLEAVFAPDVLAWRRSHMTTGRVVETGRSGRVLGRACREFLVESWGTGAGQGAQPAVFSVFASNQVPGDLAPFRAFLECLRRLHGREAEYCRALERIDGIQMRLVRVERRFPLRTRTVDEVVELDRRPAPAGIFAPPAGYERRDRITRL